MFATAYECAYTQERVPFEGLVTVSAAKRPYWVRYDLDAVRAALDARDWSERMPGLWRYRELLPLPAGGTEVSLGETMTPVLAAPRTAKALGLDRLWIKDESHLPNGSFKARGMAMAVTIAHHFGVTKAALPSAGNAAGAAAAYCARAGISLDVFMPRDTPATNLQECALHGARVHLVDGLISDCGKIVAARQAEEGWFNLATLNQPYRIEGKKTMGLELADQFGAVSGRGKRCLPDAIIYPTGGGTGLLGMWKAFAELRTLGGRHDARPVGGALQPRLYAVQADGCAPIVTAWGKNERHAEPFPNAHTLASGLRVPSSIGDFMMLDVVRDSGAEAVAGRETSMKEWMHRVAREDGISLCPEAAVALDGLDQLVKKGAVRRDEEIVLFNTATALKYAELL